MLGLKRVATAICSPSIVTVQRNQAHLNNLGRGIVVTPMGFSLLSTVSPMFDAPTICGIFCCNRNEMERHSVVCVYNNTYVDVHQALFQYSLCFVWKQLGSPPGRAMPGLRPPRDCGVPVRTVCAYSTGRSSCERQAHARAPRGSWQPRLVMLVCRARGVQSGRRDCPLASITPASPGLRARAEAAPPPRPARCAISPGGSVRKESRTGRGLARRPFPTLRAVPP